MVVILRVGVRAPHVVVAARLKTTIIAFALKVDLVYMVSASYVLCTMEVY